MPPHDLMPPTPEEMATASGIAQAASRNWGEYLTRTQQLAAKIEQLLHRAYPSGLAGRRILDWGAGLGGVAIALSQSMDAKMWTADVDRPAIKWLSGTVPHIETRLVEPGETLPFEDGFFDAVYGISVLTHIPTPLQPFYVGEIRRILKPGGTAILTVLSYTAIDYAKKSGKNERLFPESPGALDKAGIFYASYPDRVRSKLEFAQEHDYGVTYHSNAAITDLFGREFEIDRGHGMFMGKQDVLLLRAK